MTDPHRTLATRMIARIANATRLAADATDRRALDIADTSEVMEVAYRYAVDDTTLAELDAARITADQMEVSARARASARASASASARARAKQTDRLLWWLGASNHYPE